MVSQFAQNEQNMNAVERVLVYTELPPEGAIETPNDPPASWPTKGEIQFIDAKLAYREGLPLVLKGISFEVNPGEKVWSIASITLRRLKILCLDWYSRSYGRRQKFVDTGSLPVLTLFCVLGLLPHGISQCRGAPKWEHRDRRHEHSRYGIRRREKSAGSGAPRFCLVSGHIARQSVSLLLYASLS